MRFGISGTKTTLRNRKVKNIIEVGSVRCLLSLGPRELSVN